MFALIKRETKRSFLKCIAGRHFSNSLKKGYIVLKKFYKSNDVNILA